MQGRNDRQHLNSDIYLFFWIKLTLLGETSCVHRSPARIHKSRVDPKIPEMDSLVVEITSRGNTNYRSDHTTTKPL